MEINKKDKTITLNINEISNLEFYNKGTSGFNVAFIGKIFINKNDEEAIKALQYFNAFEEIETSKRNIKYNEKEIKKCSKNIEKYERIIKEVENEI